jgi:hypothetical protein
VACIPVAMQRLLSKQLYNGRYKAAARNQQQRNAVFCGPCRGVISRISEEPGVSEVKSSWFLCGVGLKPP